MFSASTLMLSALRIRPIFTVLSPPYTGALWCGWWCCSRCSLPARLHAGHAECRCHQSAKSARWGWNGCDVRDFAMEQHIVEWRFYHTCFAHDPDDRFVVRKVAKTFNNIISKVMGEWIQRFLNGLKVVKFMHTEISGKNKKPRNPLRMQGVHGDNIYLKLFGWAGLFCTIQLSASRRWVGTANLL